MNGKLYVDDLLDAEGQVFCDYFIRSVDNKQCDSDMLINKVKQTVMWKLPEFLRLTVILLHNNARLIHDNRAQLIL